VPGSPSRSDLILKSPLGRQMLTSYVSWGPGDSFDRALFRRLGLGSIPGTGALTRAGAGPRRWQDVSTEVVRNVIGAVVEWRSWREVLADVSEAALLNHLAGETFSFGFSGGDEEIWGLSAIAADQLRPVAEALLSSPGARGWWNAVDLAGQRFVEWDDQPRLTGAALKRAIHECTLTERAENDEGRRRRRPIERPDTRGAYWWSPPGFAPESWTTPAVSGLPALGLCQFFDTYLPSSDVAGATVWQLALRPDVNVLEISEPGDWQKLVARFPEDVTGTHDGEWRYWSGAPGPWLLPNWERVMEHYDGVHVSVGAAVCSAGVALPVGDAYTMLVAWVPDATLWLHDVTAEVHRLGRWYGGPQMGHLEDHPAEWTADTK
jgi:hypothetical protein